MSARRLLGSGVALLVALGAGLAAGWAIRTPDEARLPEPTPVFATALVESRSLATTTVLTGAVAVTTATPVQVTPPEGRTGVVSAAPVGSGQRVALCQVLIEISGRAVLAMPGTVRPYRDLTLGDVGPDVAQLQTALTDCGYAVPDDGEFGGRTAGALLRLLRDRRIDPATVEVTNPAYEEAQRSPAIDTSVVPGESLSGAGAGSDTPATIEQVVLPASEVVYLGGPGRAVGVLPVDTPLSEAPVLTVVSDALVLDLALTSAQRSVLAAGDPSTIAVGEQTFTAALPEIPATPSIDEGTGAAVYPVRLTLPAEVPPTAAGTEATVTVISGEATVHPAVVPLGALRAAPDGTTFVEIALADGGVERVVVTQVDAGGGYIAVSPDEDGALKVGDPVVIGASTS